MSSEAASANGAIVVLNSGSSSVKFAAFGCDDEGAVRVDRLLHGEIDGIGKAAKLAAWNHEGEPLSGAVPENAPDTPQGHAHALGLLFEWLERQLPGQAVRVVGHRVVHGGERFTRPVRVTPEVLAQLDALTPLAPLHQPHNLAAIRAIAELEPTLPQVACFDTAFHAGQDWVMQAYALPRDLRDAGIRRFGFHGLSYEYIAGVLPEHLGDRADGRVVVAHLGSGASLCALRGRRSVVSTMGFTALDGLMMGTRCGDLDPGVVLYLAIEKGLDPSRIQTLLYQESGLLGVSEISSDLRALQHSDDPRAARAIDLFVSRIGRELGSMAAAIGGLDALVFTGGIGEHGVEVRRRVCVDAVWLGIELDAAANAANASRISTASSRASAWVIPTNEELVVARQVQVLVGRGGGARSRRP